MLPDSQTAERYDGLAVAELAERLGVPALALFQRVASTMDEAHALAADGAAGGTLVLADIQTAGRGRNGKSWSSPPRGIWMTVLERPRDASALEVMSLRIGLAAARALDAFTSEPVRLKWPNDLYVDERKLAGTLVEARWRGDRLDWVAIGLGVNVEPPADQPRAGGLDAGISRLDVVEALLKELKQATSLGGQLTRDELDEYAARDLARGHNCVEPLRGKVLGIAASGELMIELADSIARVRTGSLILES